MNKWFLKSAAAASIVAITIFTSCREEERFNAEDAQALSEEAIADAYYEDADDLSSEVVYETENPSGGRVSTHGRISSDDERVACASISISEGATNAAGVITIDFSDNELGYCVIRGNKREGKIILTYSNGPRGNTGFTIVTNFEDYKINGIELKGVRTIVKEANPTDNAIKHHITLAGGEAIWPDNGGTITRESDFVRVWIRDNNPRVELDGSASGTTRGGKTYDMDIYETLVYKRECIQTEGIFMAVQGVKVFVTDSKTISIDYGDGACDKTVAITVNGVSRTVTVGNK